MIDTQRGGIFESQAQATGGDNADTRSEMAFLGVISLGVVPGFMIGGGGESDKGTKVAK